MGMKITGFDKIVDNLLKKQKEYMSKGEIAVRRGIEIIRGKMVAYEVNRDTGRLVGSISGTKSSVIIKRAEKKKKDISYNMPQADDSIFEIKVEGNTVMGKIGTNVPYAIFIEHGDTDSSGFMTRAVEDSKDDVGKIIQKTLSEV